MNLFYYSFKDDKAFEFVSQKKEIILNKLILLDLTRSFELTINKENSTVHVSKSENNYIINLFEFYDESEERIGTKTTSKTVVDKLLRNYINELNSSSTKNYLLKHHIEEKKIEKEKFELWKRTYELKKEKEKYSFLKPLAIISIIIILFVTTVYYWYTGEYKFLLQNTEQIQAKIVNTKMVHQGGGSYYQKITYEYEYNDNQYTDSELIGRRVGKKNKGDFLLLKISTIHPERNVVMRYY